MEDEVEFHPTVEQMLVSTIRHHRITSKIRQVDVAAQMGIHQSEVSDLENYSKFPRLGRIISYAEACGMRVEIKVVKD